MRKRIFKSFAILIVVAIIITFGAMEYISYQDAYENMKNWAVEDAKLLAKYVDIYGIESINDSTAGIIEGRVTVIGSDGAVLYDSDEDINLMENHFKRPEVQEAFEKGKGSATRLSQTFGKQTYYYAYKTSEGSVIRISRTMDTVMGEVFARIGIAIGIILVLIIVELFFAKSVTMRIVKPINTIDLANPRKIIQTDSKESDMSDAEISNIEISNIKISNTVNMNKNRAIYEEIEPLIDRIELQNEQIRKQMDELKKAEVIRRDFTANVSHELKTPLMSISGYAELMENGMVKQDDIKDFAARIHSEAGRLKNLVEDIIRLSNLEDSEAKRKIEKFDLYEICEEVIQTLGPYASEKNIDMTFKGEHIDINGSKQAMFEMIYNLCDNSIKYNKEGGKVSLVLDVRDERPIIEVRDNGIGIAKEDQERVFERFYRVDKSHSRKTGGTGLGLSIVKHAALLHNATISIESEPDKGTVITVRFPEISEGF